MNDKISTEELCRCGKVAGPQHCDHCDDDPPLGHVCPRCRRPAWDLAEIAAPSEETETP